MSLLQKHHNLEVKFSLNVLGERTERMMATGRVSLWTPLWLSLFSFISLASALNPDDPNVCSHWERSVFQTGICCSDLMDSTLAQITHSRTAEREVFSRDPQST